MTEIEDSNGAGRFKRIEDALTRIEQKLDSKADARDLERVEARVDELMTLGSVHAREALVEVKEMGLRVTKLENTSAAASAVSLALSNTKDNTQRMKFIAWALTISIIGTCASILFAIINLLH